MVRCPYREEWNNHIGDNEGFPMKLSNHYIEESHPNYKFHRISDAKSIKNVVFLLTI